MSDSLYIIPTQRKKGKAPRVQVSTLLKGPKRLENESFDDYKLRMKIEKGFVKDYLKGYYLKADD